MERILESIFCKFIKFIIFINLFRRIDCIIISLTHFDQLINFIIHVIDNVLHLLIRLFVIERSKTTIHP